MSMQATSADRPLSVAAWRRRQLVRGGFPLDLATRIARNGRFDIHALLELAERGCAPELAARILAPVDDDV
jgi:hypothetical protein